MDNTYYEVLELDRNATKQDLIKQKRALSLKWHPDKLPAEKRDEGVAMMQKINEAYDILIDDEKRNIYDRFGKDGLNGNMGGGHGMPDFSDFFGGMGGMGSHFHPGHGQREERPTKDIQVDLTLEELFNGKTIKETFVRCDPCVDCDGTGFEDKKTHVCDGCKGRRVVERRKQMGNNIFVMQEPCGKCNATGVSGNNAKKCQKCKGGKVIRNDYTINHELKKGTKKTVALVGEGDHIKGKRGDVVLHIKLLPHHLFKVVNEYDLEMIIDLTLEESLCGVTKSFEYLDGETKYIDINDIISNNEQKVINGLGLPKSKTYNSGNLYVKFKVDVPEHLSNECREQIYTALTGKPYDSKAMHNIPDGIEPMLLHNCNNDGKNNNDGPNVYDVEDSDEENHHHRQHGVQCAQQ